MYARSTSIVAASAAADEGIALVRDVVWPATQEMPGCLGLSMLVDREGGRSITTTAWESEEAMHASAVAVQPLRDRAHGMMGGGQPPTVMEWEIVSLHRAHPAGPGSWVRTAWSRVPPVHAGRAIDFYRETLLPQIEAIDGFASVSLLVDRASGRGVTSVAFDSRQAMEASRDHADYLRRASTQESNAEFLDVAEFELALAHLHVPELV